MTEVTETTDKKNILIITGGNVDRDFAALWVKKHKFDLCIAADSGAKASLEIGLQPDMVIGDFDSLDADSLEYLKNIPARIKRFDPEKDVTDTELALEEAVMLGAETVYMLGATGERADHTFTTLMGLVRAKEKGITVYAVDKNNKIYVVDGDIYIRKSEQHGDFVSLAVISDSAKITMEGMKYNLKRQSVCRGDSLCQSNEIADDVGHICVHSGIVMVFESRDI